MDARVDGAGPRTHTRKHKMKRIENCTGLVAGFMLTAMFVGLQPAYGQSREGGDTHPTPCRFNGNYTQGEVRNIRVQDFSGSRIPKGANGRWEYYYPFHDYVSSQHIQTKRIRGIDVVLWKAQNHAATDAEALEVFRALEDVFTWFNNDYARDIGGSTRRYSRRQWWPALGRTNKAFHILITDIKGREGKAAEFAPEDILMKGCLESVDYVNPGIPIDLERTKQVYAGMLTAKFRAQGFYGGSGSCSFGCNGGQFELFWGDISEIFIGQGLRYWAEDQFGADPNRFGDEWLQYTDVPLFSWEGVFVDRVQEWNDQPLGRDIPEAIDKGRAYAFMKFMVNQYPDYPTGGYANGSPSSYPQPSSHAGTDWILQTLGYRPDVLGYRTTTPRNDLIEHFWLTHRFRGVYAHDLSHLQLADEEYIDAQMHSGFRVIPPNRQQCGCELALVDTISSLPLQTYTDKIPGIGRVAVQYSPWEATYAHPLLWNEHDQHFEYFVIPLNYQRATEFYMNKEYRESAWYQYPSIVTFVFQVVPAVARVGVDDEILVDSILEVYPTVSRRNESIIVKSSAAVEVYDLLGRKVHSMDADGEWIPRAGGRYFVFSAGEVRSIVVQ